LTLSHLVKHPEATKKNHQMHPVHCTLTTSVKLLYELLTLKKLCHYKYLPQISTSQ